MIEAPLFFKEELLNNPIVFAYIDPGSGSVILQFIIAALVGSAFYLRKFIYNVIRLIRDKLSKKPK